MSSLLDVLAIFRKYLVPSRALVHVHLWITWIVTTRQRALYHVRPWLFLSGGYSSYSCVENATNDRADEKLMHMMLRASCSYRPQLVSVHPVFYPKQRVAKILNARSFTSTQGLNQCEDDVRRYVFYV